MEFDAKATGAAQGMKNIGAFIEDLVKHNSATMIANLPVILRQLDAGMSKSCLSLNLGLSVFYSILLVSCFMRSTALDSSGLLLL